MLDELRRKCDEVLIDTLTPALKEGMDEFLRAGISTADLLELIATTAPKNTFTYLACEAYLEQKGKKND